MVEVVSADKIKARCTFIRLFRIAMNAKSNNIAATPLRVALRAGTLEMSNGSFVPEVIRRGPYTMKTATATMATETAEMRISHKRSLGLWIGSATIRFF